MGYPRITDLQKSRYLTLRGAGLSQARAAAKAGFSERSAKAFEQGLRDSSGDVARQARAERKLPAPIPFGELGSEARRAWDDFEFFGYRYMGRLYRPWQVETAERVRERLASPHKEFVVENAPPGGGKSTLGRDIAAWLTVRDRRLRGLFGSRVENNARRPLRALRRMLERTSPPKAPSELVERGLAVDAQATLAADFGFFKPLSSDIWKADEFVVAQFDDLPIDEKEPTWSCYGMDSGVLSNRFNIIFWDDLVDKTTIRTLDAVQGQRQWWDDEAETRLEPGGLVWLVGQRMSAQDLYRYCLDKPAPLDDDEAELDGDPVDDPERPRMYGHIVYKAHFDDRCQGRETHRAGAPAYPEGCLLDPYRLPWRECRRIQTAKPLTWAVQYQQEDGQPEGVLVPEVWIQGGDDLETGEMRPGCWDEWRDLWELPKGLAGPLVSAATVDPSGKKMWAIQWFVHGPEAMEQTWLMDLERKAMPADSLLDWHADEQMFVGIMEEWQARSVLLGRPITHWIVEVNAAQRYLLAYDHVRRWMRKWGVSIIPHTTGPRKLDEDHGPYIMRDHFKSGRFRLPGKQGLTTKARIQSLKLVDELTRWPNPGVTDDLVMGCWFFFAWLPRLVSALEKVGDDRPEEPVPAWLDRFAASISGR